MTEQSVGHEHGSRQGGLARGRAKPYAGASGSKPP